MAIHRGMQLLAVLAGAALVGGGAYAGLAYMDRTSSEPRVETCWDPAVKAKVTSLLSQEFFARAPRAFGEAREIDPDTQDLTRRLLIAVGRLHPVGDPTAAGVECAAGVDLRITRTTGKYAHLDGLLVPYQVMRGEGEWLVTVQPVAIDSALREVLQHGIPE